MDHDCAQGAVENEQRDIGRQGRMRGSGTNGIVGDHKTCSCAALLSGQVRGSKFRPNEAEMIIIMQDHDTTLARLRCTTQWLVRVPSGQTGEDMPKETDFRGASGNTKTGVRGTSKMKEEDEDSGARITISAHRSVHSRLQKLVWL